MLIVEYIPLRTGRMCIFLCVAPQLQGCLQRMILRDLGVEMCMGLNECLRKRYMDIFERSDYLACLVLIHR